MIEELDDIAEDLADKLGIYSEERQNWTYEFKQRIRDCAEFRGAGTLTPGEATKIMGLLAELSGYFSVGDKRGYKDRCEEASLKMKAVAIALYTISRGAALQKTTAF